MPENVVTNYIRHGNISGAPSPDNESIINPRLQQEGEATIISTDLQPGYDIDIAANLFTGRIAGLLGHFGIQAEIES